MIMIIYKIFYSCFGSVGIDDDNDNNNKSLLFPLLLLLL